MLAEISATTMQSPGAVSDGEGLHERKAHQNGVRIPQPEEDQGGRSSPGDSEKQEKTFGRTPDGVGKSPSVSTSIHAFASKSGLFVAILDCQLNSQSVKECSGQSSQ